MLTYQCGWCIAVKTSDIEILSNTKSISRRRDTTRIDNIHFWITIIKIARHYSEMWKDEITEDILYSPDFFDAENHSQNPCGCFLFYVCC